MNDDIELVLGPPAPPSVVASLPNIPGVRVRRDEARSYLRHGSRHWDIEILPRWAVDPPEQAAASLRGAAEGDRRRVLPMVLASVLPRTLRQALAEQGISYADAQGSLHVAAPGLFLHLEAPTGAVRRPPSEQSSSLGLVGIRAVQALAAAADRTWTVADLASAADVSPAQAYRVLTALEREGLVEASGRGPAKRRRLRDLGSTLDWLAVQPRARRVYHRAACSLYARTPLDLARRRGS